VRVTVHCPLPSTEFAGNIMFGELMPVLYLSLDICASASRVLVVWFVVLRHGVSVTALPETPPVIYTEHDRYEPGDTLRANCSSPPSKPAASLSFFLNNIPVSSPSQSAFTECTFAVFRVFSIYLPGKQDVKQK
jgi:hypothetical protein